MFMLIDDFLSAEECDAVVAAAAPKLESSKVYGPSDTVDDKFRISSQAWLLQSDFPWLAERVAEHSGKPVSMQEAMQVVRYEEGGFFAPHFDACDGEEGERMNKDRGARMMTYLVYLNDDFEGGETRFPALDQDVVPKKGTLLMFFNVDGRGTVLKDMLHGGNKVTRGTKWVCNVWVRSGTV